MKIIISSDHGGYNLKNKIIEQLKSLGYETEDCGPKEYVSDDDYPDYVVPLIRRLLENDSALGILICRNGVGVNILANKYPRIRAALSFSPEHATSARSDDNANILTLAADYTLEDEAKLIVKAFLETPFSQEPRHKKRLDKVVHIENENFR